MGKQWKQWQTLFSWAPKSPQMVTAAMKLKDAWLHGRKPMKNPRQHIKKQRHHFADKGPSSQGYGFSSGNLWMWELDYKESWANARMWDLDHREIWVPKVWCFQTVVLEKTLESPLDCKEMKPVNPKGNQPWLFIGRTDVEAEAATLRPPDAKSWLIGKDPDAGIDWRQEEKGMTGWDGCMASLTQYYLSWSKLWRW